MSGVDIAGLVSEWRKAMEGATPGEWQFAEGLPRCVYAIEGDSPRTIVRTDVVGSPIAEANANAAWIARCSPSGISALLDALSEATRQRDEALAALKASEERGAGLREALQPFARACPASIIPDLHPMVGEGLGDEWRAVLFVRDFRRARSALETSKAPLADATNNPPSDPGTEQREAGRG